MPETLRVQVADGQWEILGVDRHPGITPEAVTPTWNEGGPEGLTFTLKRPVDLPSVDLEEFTPVDYMPDGERVTWSGFVIDSPGAGADVDELTVHALGWQYHGDDDVYQALYVHEDLTVWEDIRNRVEANISLVGTAAAITQVGAGAITLGWPKGAILGAGGAVSPYSAVILDCGENADGWAATVAIDYVKNSIVGAGYELRIRNNSTPDAALTAGPLGYEDAVIRASTEVNQTYTSVQGTFGTKRRYVCLVVFYTGAGITTAEDELWQITGVRTFGQAVYMSGGLSVMKASDVIKDAAARCPLWSTDQSLIAATTLSLRQLTADDETPNAVIARANGYHAYRFKIDHLRRPVFQPQSNRATLKVDLAKPGADFHDTSVNNGRPIFNKVLVRGHSGAGAPLRVTRYARDLYPERSIALASPGATNGGFEAGGGNGLPASNWTNTNQTTTTPRTGAFAGSITGLGAVPMASPEAVGDMTGATFKAGWTYRFDVWVKAAGGGSGGRINYRMRAGILGSDESSAITLDPNFNGGTYTRVSVAWTPKVDTLPANVKVGIYAYVTVWRRQPFSGMTSVLLDDVAVSRVIATTPDRRAFLRTFTLNVDAPTDVDAMAALGDAYLRLHATTPLAGEVIVTAPDAVRAVGSEAPVGPGDIGVYTGELVLLENLIDPETGELGRVAILRTVTRSDDTVTMAVDNERTSFPALLARMGARS